MLLKSGADDNYREDVLLASNPLYAASAAGHENVVRLLINRDANSN